jgi:hypothetical protein
VLSPVHGFVDAAEEPIGGFAGTILGQANRDREIDADFAPVSPDMIRRVEAFDDLAGTGLGDGEVTGQNGYELIAAPAADIIPRAHVAAEAGR